MRELQEEITELDDRIAIYDRRIREIFRTSEQCQRLGEDRRHRPGDGDRLDCCRRR